MQVAKELVGIKVLVSVEDMADKDPTRLSQLFATDLEKLAEFLHRRIRDRQRRQQVALRFPDNSRSWDQFAVLSRESMQAHS